MLGWINRLIDRSRNPIPSSDGGNYYDGMYRQMDREHANIHSLQREARGFDLSNEERATLDLITNHRIDLKWMHHQYDKVILPEVDRFGLAKFNTARASEYVQRIDLDHERNNDKHEFLRLGYVHLFHKFESFRSDIIRAIDKSNGVSGNEGIVSTMQSIFHVKIDIGSMGNAKLVEYSFIAVSSKHSGGRPVNRKHPPRFANIKVDERIKLFDFELLKDIDGMEIIYVEFHLLLAVVHNLRRLTTILKSEQYRTAPADIRDRIRLEHQTRKRNAIGLVNAFFSEISPDIKRKWPTPPDELTDDEKIRLNSKTNR